MLPKSASYLVGRLFCEETFVQAGDIAASECAPISDVAAAMVTVGCS